MSEDSEAYAEGVDFAMVAYREEGVWQVELVSPDRLGDIQELSTELRRYPGDFGALGLISVDEDFFIVMRVAGTNVRLLLSDVTAASEWPIARSVVEELELPVPNDEDDPVPAGDLGIVGDLGMDAMDMGALLDDLEAYPDEVLGEIASKIGFGPQYDELVGVAAQ